MFKNAKQDAFYIGLSTILAAFSSFAILQFTDPQKAGWVTFVFLYISLFLSVLGAFTLIGLVLRNWLFKGLYIINFSNSFRQAVLVAILIIFSLFLLSQGLLFWWVEASLILFLAFLEIFLNLKI